MKNLSAATLGKILKWSLVFIFVLGIFLTPMCHYILHIYYFTLTPAAEQSTRFLPQISLDINEYYFTVAEIYALGIVMLGIVSQLIRICRNIELNKPFDITTHNSLKYMAVLCLILVAVYAVKFAFFPDLPGLLVIFTFTVTGMFSSVFSQLFKRAAEYKEENDFTV